MPETMMQEILKRMDVLVGKVSAGGEYAFGLAMKQAFWVEGVLGVCLSLLLAVLAVVVFRAGCHFTGVLKNERATGYIDRDFDKEMRAEFGVGLSYAICSGLVLGAVINLIASVPYLVNPEYYALMELVKALTGE